MTINKLFISNLIIWRPGIWILCFSDGLMLCEAILMLSKQFSIVILGLAPGMTE